MWRGGRGSRFNPALKATPPAYLQFPYHNLLLIFLSLTETTETLCWCYLYMVGWSSVRTISTWGALMRTQAASTQASWGKVDRNR